MLDDGDYVKSYLNAAKNSIQDQNIMHTNVDLNHMLVSRALCNFPQTHIRMNADKYVRTQTHLR